MSILDHKALQSEARVREMHLEGNGLFIAGYHFNLFLYLLRKKKFPPFQNIHFPDRSRFMLCLSTSNPPAMV